MGGPIALTAPDGHRTTPADFAGKYRIVYFGFTFCPDVCPVDLALIGAGLRRFEEADPARAARVLPAGVSPFGNFVATRSTNSTPPSSTNSSAHSKLCIAPHASAASARSTTSAQKKGSDPFIR